MLRIAKTGTLALVGCILSAGSAVSKEPPRDYCNTTPIRGDAFDHPSKHAWNLFVSLNHPAVDKKIARGVADCLKPLGAPGTTSVWETWRNAASEVYLSKGAEPPLWDDTTLKDEAPGRVPLPPKPAAGGDLEVQFSPTDGIFHNAGGFGETRLNRATYEFIRSQCLFSIEGQQRYAIAVESQKKPPIQFPADSIEVKAAWIDFDDPQGDGKDGKPGSLPPIPAAQRRTYYSADYTDESGKTKHFGLIALHIITKDISNWFWASFHHKDQPQDDVVMTSPDDYGPPKSVVGTVWENYVLSGTQVDFTLPTGHPTILGDHHIEYQFVRSSCITCHATATISREIAVSPTGRKFTSMPSGQQRAVCAITPADGGGAKVCAPLLGEGAFQPGTEKLVMERGIPNPKWYDRDGKPFYLQTDFVWSIPFRGKSEEAPPPARCLW
jgi:hypothetical protein